MWFAVLWRNRRLPRRAGPIDPSAGGLIALVIASGLLALAVSTHTPEPPATDRSRPAPAWEDEPISPVPEVKGLDPERVAIGAVLFADPRLSGLGDLSCASCHDLATNGAMEGPRRFKTDTPTIFNAALSFRLGWEGKDRTLEQQTRATLAAPLIARGVPVATMVARLRRDAALDRRFRESYGRAADEAAVIDALATFQRSLVTPDSRFDRWLTGDSSALSPREKRGYASFKRLGCVACHQGRNIGGNLLQRHGIFRPLAAPEPTVLRVPSLRNVAETPPYFHDGSAPTLEIAVTRMAGAQLNVELTAQEAADIAQFLRSLTGTYRGRPVRRAR